MLSRSCPHPIIGKKEPFRLSVVKHQGGGEAWQLTQMDGGFPGDIWKLMVSVIRMSRCPTRDISSQGQTCLHLQGTQQSPPPKVIPITQASLMVTSLVHSQNYATNKPLESQMALKLGVTVPLQHYYLYWLLKNSPDVIPILSIPTD